MRLGYAALGLLLWATSALAGSVALTWDPVIDTRLTGYVVQRCLVLAPEATCTPTDLPTGLVDATQTTYLDQGLATGTYVYAVVSLGPDLRSVPSNLLTVLVGLPPTLPPTTLTVVVLVPQSLLTASADSAETSGGVNNSASQALDGLPGTFWHTVWRTTPPALPHWLRVDLPQEWWLAGLRYLPRQDGIPNGTIASYRVEVSRDGVVWQIVASGVWPATGKDWREARFPAVLAQSVRLWALSEVTGRLTYASASEVQLVQGQAPP